MIRDKLRVLVASFIALAYATQPAQASFVFLNYNSAQVTEFAFDGSTTPTGTGNCAGSVECMGDVPMDKSGTPLFTSTNPGTVTGSGGTFPVTGSVTANAGTNLNTSLLALETGGNLATAATNTGTIAGAITSSVMQENLKQVNGTTTLTGAGATGTGAQRETVAQDTTTIAGSAPGTAGTASANVLSVQGEASMTPLLANPGTAANWGIGATGSAVPANGLLAMGTNAGTAFALPGDGTNGLWVNIKAGAGSGGTAAADNAAWTVGTTNQTPAGCEYTSGGATALTTGHVGTPGCTSARGLFTDKSSVAGTALSAAVSAYGTAPTGTEVEGVNAFVTNTNANGQTTMSASSPVVIASNQSPVPVSPTTYPATAVPLTATATGTTGATTATLTNVSGHTTYICGFSIRANAAAAATGNATVTGTITATINFTQWTAPNASGLGVTEEVFSPCVPASAVSTSIAVISAAPGTSGVVSVSAWGYSI